MKIRHLFFLFLLGITFAVNAQTTVGSDGIEWGNFRFRPKASAAVTYDNRVLSNASSTEGDIYSELTAGFELGNLPARYNLFAGGIYGQRFYNEYTVLDDDFYSGEVGLKSDQGLLNWGVSSEIRKDLNYNTSYDPSTGSGPDGILTDVPNRRSSTRGSISYDLELSARTSLVPEYGLWHYYQELEGAGSTEWQVHHVGLPLRYAYSDKTYISAGGAFSLQTNEDEDGYIGTAFIGAESRATDKTTYSIMLGASFVEYDLSGSDVGGVSDVRVEWKATDKVSLYVFGGNRFQPGYGGGPARMVFRAGYGANWRFAERWFVNGQGLHDYEQALGSDSGSFIYGGVRHFFDARLGYTFPKYAEISVVGRLINDEEVEDRTTLSIRLDCKI
ncbi:MAG: hypothetical protein V3V05_00795 [Pontiella sp.]